MIKFTETHFVFKFMDTNASICPKSEPALELHSRAAPSVEAHHHVSGANTGRNARGRRIKKMQAYFNTSKVWFEV